MVSSKIDLFYMGNLQLLNTFKLINPFGRTTDIEAISKNLEELYLRNNYISSIRNDNGKLANTEYFFRSTYIKVYTVFNKVW